MLETNLSLQESVPPLSLAATLCFQNLFAVEVLPYVCLKRFVNQWHSWLFWSFPISKLSWRFGAGTRFLLFFRFRFPETFWNGWQDKCLPTVFWYLPGTLEGKWDAGSGCGVSHAILSSLLSIHCSEWMSSFPDCLSETVPHHSLLVPLIFFLRSVDTAHIVSHIVIYLRLFSRRIRQGSEREWGLGPHQQSSNLWCASEPPGGLVKTRSLWGQPPQRL